MTLYLILITSLIAAIFVPVDMASAEENPIQECMKNIDQSFQQYILDIKNNPCLRCMCSYEGKSQVCRMTRMKCEPLACSLQEAKPKECCRKCKGCSFQGIYYEDKAKWSDVNNTCRTYECHEGIVSETTPKCVSNCQTPVNVPGQCCPLCKGCVYKGKSISEGSFYKDGGNNVTCHCTNGTMSCTKEVCPFLHCSKPVSIDGLQCPVCTRINSPTVFNWREAQCQIKDKKLNSGEIYKLNKCTTCTCNNGTVFCEKEQCKVDKNCPLEDLVKSPKHCCPICTTKLSCKYNGKSYKNQEKWYLAGCVECQCKNGLTMCKKQLCQKNLYCKDGFKASFRPGSCCEECLPETRTCIGFGDPHYRTFDGKAYSYQGVCKYTLTKDCSKDNKFHIIGRNHARYTNHFSWIKTVTFIYGNITITLQQNYKVKINGQYVRLPFLYRSIDIRKSARYVYVYTEDGITVKWDGDSYIDISLPRSFMNRVCGLCGNYNDVASDDFMLPNGVEAVTPSEFGDHWKLKKSKVCKRHANTIRNTPRHAMCFGWKLFRAHQICRRAFSDRSILPCRWKTPTFSYFKDCVTDVCQCPTGKQHCECGAIRSYFEKCSNEVRGLRWKRKDKCDTSCTGGSIFSTCGPGCRQTCDYINSLEPCNKACVPGCHCPAGFVWHQNKCILQFDCPNFKKKKRK